MSYTFLISVFTFVCVYPLYSLFIIIILHNCTNCIRNCLSAKEEFVSTMPPRYRQWSHTFMVKSQAPWSPDESSWLSIHHCSLNNVQQRSRQCFSVNLACVTKTSFCISRGTPSVSIKAQLLPKNVHTETILQIYVTQVTETVLKCNAFAYTFNLDKCNVATAHKVLKKELKKHIRGSSIHTDYPHTRKNCTDRTSLSRSFDYLTRK